MNATVMNGHDVTIPSQEPMVAALAAGNVNLQGPSGELAGKGGVTQELNDPTLANGMSATEQERTAQAIEGTPVLPGYLAEKYSLRRSAGGRWYLSPLTVFLEYVAGTKAKPGVPAIHGAASRAAEYGFGLVYPEGKPDATEEAQRVNEMAEEASAFMLSLKAFDEKEAEAFGRFLIDRATRKATYAATTQFELENWARRAAARNQNAADHPSYNEKSSKLDTFALGAGVALAVAKRVLTNTFIGPDTFDKAALRIVYENANFEGSKLLNPTQLDERQAAEVEATKALVRRF